MLCTWYGDRYEFRDGAPTADGVLLLGELAMMVYDAMDFASEAGSLQGLSTTDMWGQHRPPINVLIGRPHE